MRHFGKQAWAGRAGRLPRWFDASVDVNSAPNILTRTYVGVADRSTQNDARAEETCSGITAARRLLTRFKSGRPDYYGQDVVYPGNNADPRMT
jgi:hypothetical protein